MAHPHDDYAHEDHVGHTHGPGSHVHAPANFGTAFAIGIALNSAFVIIEGIFGYVSNSMALVADAGHNLSDVLGLVVAWVAAILSKRAPSTRFTYGLRVRLFWLHCSMRSFYWSLWARSVGKQSSACCILNRLPAQR